MAERLPPSVPLGARPRPGSRQGDLATRIRMVLETRPGRLPWRPDFGCELGNLVGEPATPQRLAEARWRIEEAIRRWVPDVAVTACQVRVVTDLGAGPGTDRTVPLAESALVRLGVQGTLEIRVDLQTHEGPLAVQALLSL